MVSAFFGTNDLSMKSSNLALRFLLELGALAGLAHWGWQTGTSRAGQYLLAGGAPLLAALIWGRLVAPKAPSRLEDPVRAGVEVVFFGTATTALVLAGAVSVGIAFGILAVVSLGLMFVLGQRGL